MVPTMANPPVLSPEQRAAALQKAAEARTARAELKEKLKMGSLTLSDALSKADADDVIGKLKVVSMLESLPGLGKVKARRVMEAVGISESRRVRGLGPQQRQALLEQLG
jgi:signal recognition particle GTPase